MYDRGRLLDHALGYTCRALGKWWHASCCRQKILGVWDVRYGLQNAGSDASQAHTHQLDDLLYLNVAGVGLPPGPAEVGRLTGTVQ